VIGVGALLALAAPCGSFLLFLPAVLPAEKILVALWKVAAE
jgi:hypothetical protein